ncbi:hypothetical protein HFA01_28720 [Halobacillus faecis]|uniref:Transposase IS4-like domain-containing protein n=1 Tax=Halobacillus faecis TaxID=360184 RepID=A0A511WTX7_9BACI|nr:hypothetical protein HFA01_28720 [Halobacillus faecis]
MRDVPPEIIAHVYKLRWQIELFFRWIKQNLEIDHLFGRSENAVYGQVFGTLIAYVLLRWLYNDTETKWRLFASPNFLAFTRKFVYQTLPVEVRSEIQWFFLQGIGLSSKEEINKLVNNV